MGADGLADTAEGLHTRRGGMPLRPARGAGVPGLGEAISALNRTYGPIAFGLVAVLIIWVFIVAPELKVNRTDAGTMAQVAGMLRDATEATKQTAVLLDGVSRRLERIEERRSP